MDNGNGIYPLEEILEDREILAELRKATLAAHGLPSKERKSPRDRTHSPAPISPIARQSKSTQRRTATMETTATNTYRTETFGYIRTGEEGWDGCPAVIGGDGYVDKDGMLWVTEGHHGGAEVPIRPENFEPNREAFFSLGSSAGVPEWIDGTATVKTYHNPDWAECPKCIEEYGLDYSKFDVGVFNIGRTNNYYCKNHKTTWTVGVNVWESWKNQTEEEQRAIRDAIGFNSLVEIDYNTLHEAAFKAFWAARDGKDEVSF
jgi:hypothetical protein